MSAFTRLPWPAIPKSVLFGAFALLLFALIANFVKAVLFGAMIYAWVATALALHCLWVPDARRHPLVRLHAQWTGGYALFQAGFAAILLVGGFKLTAIAYGLAVGLWLFRSGNLHLTQVSEGNRSRL